MPLQRVQRDATTAIINALKEVFDYDGDTVDLKISPNRAMGDLAWPGALPLAKVLHKAPRQIAEAISENAKWPDMVDRVEIAGPGFLNLFLDRRQMLSDIVRNDGAVAPSETKVIVEHTNINPNKAAHIGHLRNAVLGDILVRSLRFLGHRVEVQNYIDDTGVQVADVVVGILHLPVEDIEYAFGLKDGDRKSVLEALVNLLPGEVIPSPSVADFDDLCWQVYPLVTSRYADDPEFVIHRTEVLHMVEAGFGELDLPSAIADLNAAIDSGSAYPGAAVARLSAAVADGNMRCHLATMARLGVSFDLLPHESDILHLGFWKRAFELLKSNGAIRLEGAGKNAGCWVMSLASSPEFVDMDDPDKILVRSNGTVTYTGKDIAYQMWKLGLLLDEDGKAHDFGYEAFSDWLQDTPADPVRYGAGPHCLARSTSNRTSTIPNHSFGSGNRVYNVIDVRQSYPQKVVKEAVRVLGHQEAADASIHFAYEMVALTPRAVRLIEKRTGVDFGLSDEDMAKAFVEMSGRRGIGVKADEFLDILTETAADSIRERAHDEKTPADINERSQSIAVGALRYLMARQSRNRVLAFDFDEALAFEGDTGPYLQYSAVRAARIFTKLMERRGEGRFEINELELLGDAEIDDGLWELLLECARRYDVVAQSVANLEFSLLAQHVHNLAQLFHKLYHAHPIVPEENVQLRRLRRAVFTVFVDEITTLLTSLLGIPVPSEM